MNNKWHATKTGNHQGLVYDEVTGENVAVTYKAEHAQLIATAPELLELVVQAYGRFTDNDMQPPNHALSAWLETARTAINKAKGE